MRIEGFRFYFLLMILASCQLALLSQYSAGLPGLSDSVSTKPSKSHSLYFTSGYSDNLVIASSVSHRQPYYSAAISYFYNNSFYLGTSSFHLKDYQPFSALSALTAGYYHDFYSWLDVNLSLSGYKISEQLENTLFESFINADLKVGIDWKLIYTEISASSIFGESSSIFYQMKNSKYIQVPGIFGKKVNVSFQPYADLIFGSMQKITFDGNTITGVKSRTARWGNRSFIEDFTTDENFDAGQGSSTGSGSGSGSINGTGTNNANNQGQGGNSENPASPGGAQDPGPSDKTDTDHGSGAGTESGSGSGYGTGAGQPNDTQTGGENGTHTDSSDRQTGGDPASGTEAGQEDDKTNQSTVDPSPATDQDKKPGTESDPAQKTNPDKFGSGTGTKGNNLNEISGTIPDWSITDFFGLMEIELGMPVSFTTGRFIFELEPGYVKSMYNDPYIPVPEGFTFTMSVYIKIL